MDELLKLYKESITRSRNIFLFLGIASLMLFTVFFNYRISWLKTSSEIFKSELADPKSFQHDFIKSDTLTFHDSVYSKLTQIGRALSYNPGAKGLETVEIEHQSFEVPILGIHLYAQDATLIGGFAISLLLAWLLVSRKRDRSICAEIIEFNIDGIWKKKTDTLAVKTDDFKNPLFRDLSKLHESDRDTFRKAYNEIRFSTIFNRIPHIEPIFEENSPKIIEVILKYTIKYLYFLPVVVYVLIFYFDFKENCSAQ